MATEGQDRLLFRYFTLPVTRRILVRRCLTSAMAIPGLTGLLAACGERDQGDVSGGQAITDGGQPAAPPKGTSVSSGTPSPGGPKYGDTLRIVHPNDFVTMWPMFTTGPTLDRAYDHLVALAWNGSAWEIVPWLAESWELSDTAAVFKLRSGVRFHDGTELDAEAVRWNVEMWMTHPQSIASTALEGVDPDKPAEVIDKYTIRINLTAPKASLLMALSDYERTTGIASPAAWESLGEDGVKLKAVGSGPFIFQEWQTGSRLTVKRNEAYWATDTSGNRLPFVDGIIYRWVSDDSARLIEMRSGNADATIFIRGRDVPTIRQDPKLIYIEDPASGGTMYRIFFNARRGPFAEDRPLRQAVLYAIDREAIAKAVGGGVGFAAKYELLPGAVGYDESIPYYWFDLEKAKSLRKESLAPPGLTVRLTIIAREGDQQMAQMIQAMLAEIDLNVQIEALERVAWGDKVRRNNDFEFATQRATSPLDPDPLWTLNWAPEGPAAYARPNEPEIWQLIAEGRATYDPAKRHQIYKEVQTRMFEAAWWGVIWIQPSNYLFSTRIHGIPKLYGENLVEHLLWIEG